MIRCYANVWPDHPFVFRVPYQRDTSVPRFGPVEFMPTVPDIRRTVLHLLEDLPDEEWIYWCIDDKYPVILHLETVRTIHSLIVEENPPDASGILFCRTRRVLQPENLFPDVRRLGRLHLLERRYYHQIWIHQFLRVKVIRHLFQNFPDVISPASIMDPLKDRLTKPAHHRLFVTEENHAVFGESTTGGLITENCACSLAANGFPLPEWHTGVLAPEMFFGSE